MVAVGNCVWSETVNLRVTTGHASEPIVYYYRYSDSSLVSLLEVFYFDVEKARVLGIIMN